MMATACVSQRCGLCGFELQKGDKIVASKFAFEALAICLLTYLVTDGGQQSGEMYNDFLMNDGQDATFEQCLGTCSHPDGRAIGCHAMCANHIPLTSREMLLKVLAYQYEPSPFEITRRMRWIRLRFASTPILRHVKPQLPKELRLQIAKHLLQGPALHQYVIACTDTLPENKECGESRIRLSAEIWARFIDFEGLRYISSLSNTHGNYHTESIFTPDPTQTVTSIYIAENFLGVTQVLFSTAAQAPAVEERQGLWWRIIPLTRCETVLATQTDVSAFAVTANKTNESQGVKLRSIVLEDEEVGSPANPLWSFPPSGPIRSVQLEPSLPAARLLTLTYNTPDVIAYSARWKGRIMSLHAHLPGEDSALYKGYEEGIWVYFPLEKGERISEIWKHSQFKQGSSLIVSNLGNDAS